jgi:Rieske 2Fe-2S family protein
MSSEGQGVRADQMKSALAPKFYQSAEIFTLETERIFHGQWFCVGREAQIPERGDYLHVSVAGEQVIVVRGKDDSLAAFYNVCRHRGSRLTFAPPLPDAAQPALSSSGRFEGGAVVCPYHAWSYNLDGTLRAAPFVRFDESCPKSRFSLVPVQIDTWGGFVFVRLGGAGPSLTEQLGHVPTRLARYPLADLRRGHQLVYEVNANWKIIMENYNECYHCGPVHPELCALVPAFREQGGAGLEWDDGIPHRPGAWTFTASGTSTRAPFPGLSEKEKTQRGGRARRRVHAVAHRPGAHAHRLRFPVPRERGREAGLRSQRRRGVLGCGQSARLEDLRVRAGGNELARLPRRLLRAHGRSQPRHPALSREAPGRAGARRRLSGRGDRCAANTTSSSSVVATTA